MSGTPELSRGDEYVVFYTGGPYHGQTDTRISTDGSWDDEVVHDAIGGPVGSTLAWLVNTLASAVIGLVVGAVVVAVLHVVRRKKHTAAKV